MDGVIDPRMFPRWVTRPLRQGVRMIVPSRIYCRWCGDYLPIFGPSSVHLGNGYAHKDCADRAERFALKSSIRHRTNPLIGYFHGWKT